jgi:hypothetical protein
MLKRGSVNTQYWQPSFIGEFLLAGEIGPAKAETVIEEGPSAEDETHSSVLGDHVSGNGFFIGFRGVMGGKRQFADRLPKRAADRCLEANPAVIGAQPRANPFIRVRGECIFRKGGIPWQQKQTSV